MGKKYVAFDVFEFADGEIIKKWHTQDEFLEQKTPSGHTQIDGPTTIDKNYNADDTRKAGGVSKKYFDLFRVEKGYIVEHWDIVSEI